MIRKTALLVAVAFGVVLSSSSAMAAGGGDQHIEDIDFSFEGVFGTYDQLQLQRGLQVFTEVCSACHGLKFVPLRTLSDEGGPALPVDQMRAYAASLLEITDKNTGEDRPREPTDHFPSSGLVTAPDLSLMAKARAGFHGPYGTGISPLLKGVGGPEYIYSLLTGYTGEEKEEAGSIFYENTAFPGGWISMSPPLYEDGVEYADGHEASVEHMAEDVTAFLMWAAEPHLASRKQAGFQGAFFLAVLSVLLYFTNKRLWSSVKGTKKS